LSGARSWSTPAHGKDVDLSPGTAPRRGCWRRSATPWSSDYDRPPLGQEVERVGGVDLNHFLPFRSGTFDAVDLVEVIEHIENQAQLIREIRRVLSRAAGS
jgi:SAM-dependent methyltransferase